MRGDRTALSGFGAGCPRRLRLWTKRRSRQSVGPRHRGAADAGARTGRGSRCTSQSELHRYRDCDTDSDESIKHTQSHTAGERTQPSSPSAMPESAASAPIRAPSHRSAGGRGSSGRGVEGQPFYQESANRPPSIAPALAIADSAHPTPGHPSVPPRQDVGASSSRQERRLLVRAFMSCSKVLRRAKTIAQAIAQATASASARSGCLHIRKDEHEATGVPGAETGPVTERASASWVASERTATFFESCVSGLATFSRDAYMVGEIKRHLEAANDIMSGIAKPGIKPDACDAAFGDLLAEICRTCDLAQDERNLLATDNPFNIKPTVLVEISRVWVGCARFVSDEYVKKSLWSEAARNHMHGHDRIVRFKKELATLLEGWQDAHLRHREVSLLSKRLDPVRGAGLDAGNTCISGTRTGILQKLTEWVDLPHASRVLFLVGVAGSGKTTIASTLAVQLRDQNRLGAFFAFNRGSPDRVPRRLLCTLAYELALWNEGYRDVLVRQFRDYPGLELSSNLAELWNHLIVQPAAALASSEPVLLVVDAFDDCPGGFQSLLELFTSNISELRANFRVLITSRAEQNIIAGTQPSQRFDIGRTPATKDIRLYVRTRLLRSDAGLSDNECEELTRAADGLFQWAATSCAFLEKRPAGTSIQNKYLEHQEELMVGSARGKGGLPCLDDLYRGVLEATLDHTDEPVMRRFRIAMSLVLCAAEPLSLTALCAIHPLAEDSREKVDGIFDGMGVVLEGISDPSMPLRPIHASFRHFLLDATRSGCWHIFPNDLEAARRALSIGTSYGH